MREFLEIMLGREGYEVKSAETGRQANAMLGEQAFDLVLCDIRLGDISGLDVLRKAKAVNPETVVIMISAYATAENAVEAMNEGAYDYVPKPFDNDELKQTISKALELKTLSEEKNRLEDELRENLHFGLLVGNSPRMRHIYEVIEQVAPTKTSVMITGESGTGKELIAQAIHNLSNRADKPFVVINCGSIPETLWKASFSGIKRGRLQAPTRTRRACLRPLTRGRFFSTRWAS